MIGPLHIYWLARRLNKCGLPLIPGLLDYISRILFSCWIPHTALLGRHIIVGYGGLGIVIHGDAKIGNDVHIDQGVTIGGNATELGVPTIGNGVYIGAGAKILGPVAIGNDSVIGANAVVVTDIPDHCVAVGIPARIIKKNINPSTILYHRRAKG